MSIIIVSIQLNGFNHCDVTHFFFILILFSADNEVVTIIVI